MAQLTNTPPRTSESIHTPSLAKESRIDYSRAKDRGALPVVSSSSRITRNLKLITGLAENYFHSFIYRLFSQKNKQTNINIMHESRMLEIDELSLVIVLPRPYSQNVWEKQKQLKASLCRGSMILEDDKELFFYFSFSKEDKTSIQILDVPFIMLSLVEAQHNDMKAFLQQTAKGGTTNTPVLSDPKQDFSSFKMTIEYLIQQRGMSKEKISLREL